MTLQQWILEWTNWSKSSHKTFDGWEADFPNWESLIRKAEEVLLSQENSAGELAALDNSWAISNEDEQLCEFSKENIQNVWKNLIWLAKNGSNDTRWQVYEAMSAAGAAGERYLRTALSDPDPYCLRRAILSLSDFRPADAEQIAKPFLESRDPYIVKAAKILRDQLSR